MARFLGHFFYLIESRLWVPILGANSDGYKKHLDFRFFANIERRYIPTSNLMRFLEFFTCGEAVRSMRGKVVVVVVVVLSKFKIGS